MTTTRRVSGRELACAAFIIAVGVAVRWPHLHDSLWYDEMTTLVDFVLRPWSKVVAARAGDYVPNNHVLHTILVKLVYAHPELVPPREALLRLPALVAGLLVPLALAWPMRRSEPRMALAVALAATLHPWLVEFSTEARGYSLMLLLGIIATNLLPCTDSLAAAAASPVMHRRFIAYGAVLTLAIYTIPLAVLLIPAHAAAMLLRRGAIVDWIKGAVIALVLSTLLYLPMIRGLLSYYRNPYLTTMSYPQFLDALPRAALTGIASTGGAAVVWALPVIAILVGSILCWSRRCLRPLLITLGVATILGILFPLISTAATEPRFDPWILPWFCLAMVAALFSAQPNWAKVSGGMGFFVLLAFQLRLDVTMPPAQPIREALRLAQQIAPPDRDIMVLYLGARESIALYGEDSKRLLAAPDIHNMQAMEQRAMDETGHLPWVVIYYEKLAMQRNFQPGDARGLYTSLVTLYDVQTRLDGRLTPVAIYRPKEKQNLSPQRRGDAESN